jgi:RNA 3'-terminal phosphate cyclase
MGVQWRSLLLVCSPPDVEKSGAEEAGTSFLFHPGLLPGGRYTHTCHPGRSIGYYLEVLIPLAPFGKTSLDVILNGVTGEEGRDMTVSLFEREFRAKEAKEC